MTTKLEKEKQTMTAMIGIYCHALHGTDGKNLCPKCRQLLEYAQKRLFACKFRDDKPPCSKCSIHCYKPEMRKKITQVMRYAGPRMLKRHPILAARHIIAQLRHKPEKKQN
jgi:hypothetical protein